MWNDKVSSYGALCAWGPTAITRYEDLVRSVEGFAKEVAAKFALPLPEVIIVPSRSTKNDGRATSDIIRYYTTEAWLSKLTARDIQFINRHVDRDLMSTFKYDVL
jgi:hypothetical protein